MSEDVQKYVTNSMKSVYEAYEGKLDFKMIDVIVNNLISKDSLIQEKENLGYALIKRIKKFNPEIKITSSDSKHFFEKPSTLNPATSDDKTIDLIEESKIVMEQINTLVGDSILKSQILSSLIEKSQIDSRKNKALKTIVESMTNKTLDAETITDLQLFKSNLLGLEQKELEGLNSDVQTKTEPIQEEEEESPLEDDPIEVV
jgi:hypothetical protein